MFLLVLKNMKSSKEDEIKVLLLAQLSLTII